MKRRTKTKRPNPFVYYLFGFIVSFLSFAKRQVLFTYRMPDGREVHGSKVREELVKVKPPYIIVGNHHSLYDYVFAIRAFYPRRITFIVARKLYLASKFHFFVRMARAIPKNLFQPDIQTIRQSFDILGNEGILALYPEGQIVINGISKDMPESCAKLIKKMKLPVFAIRTSGAYFCDSTWRKCLKHGIIDIDISMALTPEKIKEMSIEEIDDAIGKAIYVDNFAEQEKSGYLYKGRNRAKGLENILYRCPSCGSEFELETHKNSITCKSCGCTAEYTESAHLSWNKSENFYPHIGEWYNAQRLAEKKAIEADSDYEIFIPVELRILSEAATVIPSGEANLQIKKTRGIEKCGKGVLHIRKCGYTYSGDFFGEQKEIEFDVMKVRYVPYTPGDNFQIYVQDVMFAFYTIDRRYCAKAALVMESIYASQAEKLQPVI